MAWTKRQLIEQAFEEIGYATYVYDLEPQRIEHALYRMDSMVAQWNGKGIVLPYPLKSEQGGDLDDDSGLPDWAYEAVYTKLAIQLASTIGKTVSPELRQTARSAYKALLHRTPLPRERRFPETLPLGQGNRQTIFEETFFPRPGGGLEVHPGDGDLELE